MYMVGYSLFNEKLKWSFKHGFFILMKKNIRVTFFTRKLLNYTQTAV